MAAGFVPPPKSSLPTSWEESRDDVTWELPTIFQAPQAALAVYSAEAFIRQTTMEALTAEANSAHTEVVKVKKLGVKRNQPVEKEKKKAVDKVPPPEAFVPMSREGSRFTVAPLVEAPFILQAGMPEYQVQWLSHLLPEGKRPTACSLQVAPAAMLSALCEQPDFIAAEGTAMAVLVLKSTIYFAGYRQGEVVLFRECPGAGGYDVMHELVKSGLGVGDDLVDSILEDTLIDPRSSLEPLVRPVLQQLQLSLDYLAQRHQVHVDRVFLMGLPSGAGYWNQFALETIGVPFVAPNVFDGLVKSSKAGNVPNGLAPNLSQAFLAALGAARAAMEGTR